ncbi:excinuclease ABC subunit UvrA [Candidatus Berkelbacteria bacterium]|nr:excinuclease ABC subunit UvrA [Candidatus Berkelbacteria bacterium]
MPTHTQFIEVKGARVNNLKNISVKLPRDKITVITGISGSGKSSLAFDTIFAEGQRRYVESVSSFARQYLGIIEKPDVDEITGLSPALSIDQKSAVRSPRSTVGTMSEVYDYLRLAFSVAGKPSCVNCGTEMVLRAVAGKERKGAKKAYHCPNCGTTMPELTLSSFSFNSPQGACQGCQGLGKKLEIDEKLIMPNPRLTLAEGAIRPWSRIAAASAWQNSILEKLSQAYGINLHTPVGELKPSDMALLLKGTGGEPLSGGHPFEGIIANLERRHRETDSEYIRRELEKYMRETICPHCNGARLKPEILHVRLLSKTITQLTALRVEELETFAEKSLDSVGEKDRQILKPIFSEMAKRLRFMAQVGLSYLTLDRNAVTLAGGEAQRIRLATQLGSALIGVTYILDEPSIGLHSKDQQKLLDSVRKLCGIGNTVIIVEHDTDTMKTADHIIDIGPGAGAHGGQVVAQGSFAEIVKAKHSLTGQYLAGAKVIPLPKKRRRPSDKKLIITGATQFNLKNVTFELPLGLFVVVSGVSGSGKSTLIDDTLARALARKFHHAQTTPGAFTNMTGLHELDKVIIVDQSPIGRTPRSNPATYTGISLPLRDLFANIDEAKKRRYTPARFSFNLKGGRCETCHGDGVLRIEMHFLPNVWLTCETCGGKRFNDETLAILYKEKTIADVLDMTVDEAYHFFSGSGETETLERLAVLRKVGLGYIKLGQPATTLSGGEAQRVKLATELARPTTGKTLYILDEPTTGLHFEDIRHLLTVLHELVDKGNTVLVVEHNLDVIRNADWVIDMGPDGGDNGGEIVAAGTPEQVANVARSHTGQFLKKIR